MDTQAQDLQQQYKLRFGPAQAYRDEVWKILCKSFFSRHVPADGAVLDMGAGWGEFINNIPAGRKFAMDLNPETQERLAAGITFLHRDCAREWPLDVGSLDVVFTSNFLEHLPDRGGLERTITEAHRCLKAGGRIICLGPNVKYAGGAYWDFWDHRIPLTEMSLSELLAMKGFRVDVCIPRFLPFTMSGGSTPPLFAVGLYLRLPWIWPLFGKQFLVMGRKAS